MAEKEVLKLDRKSRQINHYKNTSKSSHGARMKKAKHFASITELRRMTPITSQNVFTTGDLRAASGQCRLHPGACSGKVT